MCFDRCWRATSRSADSGSGVDRAAGHCRAVGDHGLWVEVTDDGVPLPAHDLLRLAGDIVGVHAGCEPSKAPLLDTAVQCCGCHVTSNDDAANHVALPLDGANPRLPVLCSETSCVYCAILVHAMLSRVPAQFADMLTGGHRNSLGRTEQVVGIVLADQGRLEELFETMTHPDEVVRMRVGDALDKVCREQPGWFVPQIDRICDDIGAIDQPSVQWHVAQMLQHLRGELSADQAQRATRLLQRNLTGSMDWIVLNVTMDVLTNWSRCDPSLARWLTPELERMRRDKRKSVAKRASMRLTDLAR